MDRRNIYTVLFISLLSLPLTEPGEARYIAQLSLYDDLTYMIWLEHTNKVLKGRNEIPFI